MSEHGIIWNTFDFLYYALVVPFGWILNHFFYWLLTLLVIVNLCRKHQFPFQDDIAQNWKRWLFGVVMLTLWAVNRIRRVFNLPPRTLPPDALELARKVRAAA